jgi:hypothetical protein
MLLKYSQIRAFGKTSQRDHQGLFNWIWTNKPLAIGYYDFIFHEDDFVSVPKCSEQGGMLERGTYLEDKIRSHVTHYPKSPLKVSYLFAFVQFSNHVAELTQFDRLS